MNLILRLLKALLPLPRQFDKETGKPLYGVLAEFDNVDALLAGCRAMRDAGYKKFDAHTPFPVHHIERAMGMRRTILPYLVLVMGILGGLSGVFLVWYTNATSFEELPYYFVGYEYIISGKPIFSFAANIPPVFELVILFSAFTAGLGMLLLNRLPMLHSPLFQVEDFRRATDDKLFIAVEAHDPRFDQDATAAALTQAGASKVQKVEG